MIRYIYNLIIFPIRNSHRCKIYAKFICSFIPFPEKHIAKGSRLIVQPNPLDRSSASFLATIGGENILGEKFAKIELKNKRTIGKMFRESFLPPTASDNSIFIAVSFRATIKSLGVPSSKNRIVQTTFSLLSA